MQMDMMQSWASCYIANNVIPSHHVMLGHDPHWCGNCFVLQQFLVLSFTFLGECLQTKLKYSQKNLKIWTIRYCLMQDLLVQILLEILWNLNFFNCHRSWLLITIDQTNDQGINILVYPWVKNWSPPPGTWCVLVQLDLGVEMKLAWFAIAN